MKTNSIGKYFTIEKILKINFQNFHISWKASKNISWGFLGSLHNQTIVKYVFHEMLRKKYFTVYPRLQKYKPVKVLQIKGVKVIWVKKIKKLWNFCVLAKWINKSEINTTPLVTIGLLMEIFYDFFNTNSHPLREKCPNTEFFLVRIFLHSDWIRREILSVSGGEFRIK